MLPRTVLTRLDTSRVRSGVIARVGDETFPITCGMFGLGRGKAFLAANGWPLDEDMVPTTAPIHGPGYGLDADVAAAARPGAFKRVIYIVLALLLLALVIAGEIARWHTH